MQSHAYLQQEYDLTQQKVCIFAWIQTLEGEWHETNLEFKALRLPKMKVCSM